MMDIISSKPSAPVATVAPPATQQFACCQPTPGLGQPNLTLGHQANLTKQQQQQQQHHVAAGIEGGVVENNVPSTQGSSPLVLYVTNNPPGPQQHVTTHHQQQQTAQQPQQQQQQYHQNYDLSHHFPQYQQQDMFHHQNPPPQQPPPYQATYPNYSTAPTATLNSDCYQQQQQQQQHVRTPNIPESDKKQLSVPPVATPPPPNSIYNSKINIFQSYYQHQNFYNNNEDGNKNQEVETSLPLPYSSPPAATGYIATVTAVAGGSPNGNVTSSSYFSSSSCSPSTGSRCDSVRSVESSCSSTDSGVELQASHLNQAITSFSPPPPVSVLPPSSSSLSLCSTSSSSSTPIFTTSSSLNQLQTTGVCQVPAPPPPQQQPQPPPPPPPPPPPQVIPQPNPPLPPPTPQVSSQQQSQVTVTPVASSTPQPQHHRRPSPLTPQLPMPIITEVSVPAGWRRLLINDTIVYVSPSGTELGSREAVRQYVSSANTCKCGLECPLQLDRVFIFDTKVTNRAWPLSTELSRLCNHKRKQASVPPLLMPGSVKAAAALAQQQGQQPLLHHHQQQQGRQQQQLLHQHSTSGDPQGRSQQQHSTAERAHVKGDGTMVVSQASSGVGAVRRRRRRGAQAGVGGNPYDGALVSQLLAQRDRLQTAVAAAAANPVQGLTSSGATPGFIHQQQHHGAFPPQHKDIRVWEIVPPQHIQPALPLPPPQEHLAPPPPPNPPRTPSQQQPLQPQNPPQAATLQQVHASPHLAQLFTPQLRPSCQIPATSATSIAPQPPQTRQFPVVVSSVPTTYSEPIRLYSTAASTVQQQSTITCSGGSYLIKPPQYLQPTPPPLLPNNTVANQQQQQQQQQALWSTSISTLQCFGGAYDNKGAPQHQLSWDDVSKRKKSKTKKIKLSNNPCPNVDVRQISQIESRSVSQQQQQVITPQPPQQTNYLSSGVPSFMEDPNGYLAQQTALLNSTILKQTGLNIISQRQPQQQPQQPSTQLQQQQLQPEVSTALSSSSIVPLPSNIILPKVARTTQSSSMLFSQASSSETSTYVSPPDSASECQACCMNNAVAAALLQASKESQELQQLSTQQPTLQPQEPTVLAEIKPAPMELGALDSPPAVTSSTLTQEKASPNPDPSGPIQGGTVSTSETSAGQEGVPSPWAAEKRESPSVMTSASGSVAGSNLSTSVQADSKAATDVLVPQTSGANVVTKTPLEMVQSVVSSIQVPPPPAPPQPPPPPPQTILPQQIKLENNTVIDSNLLKNSLPPGHILVSSNGQLIVQKVLNSNNQSPANANAGLQQILPTVTQPMVQLLNTLPAPLLLQPNTGVLPQTVTVDGVQLTLAGNLNNLLPAPDALNGADLLSTTIVQKKKGKKRKVPPQTVASMLQLQNPQVIMQNFQTISPQQQQPLLQTVTILPNNKPQFLQFPANPQAQPNTQQPAPQQQPQQQFGNLGGHLLTSPNSINLIHPLNLLNNASSSFVPNFPLLQGGTTLVVPSLQGIQGMVSLPDGTLVSPDPNSHATVQLQLGGQQVLAQLQGQNMLPQNLIATPGMVIRPQHATQMISNKITTATGQVISQNGQLISPQSQFLVNGTAFSQQTALNGLMVNTGQPMTLTTQNASPSGAQNAAIRASLPGDFIQCMNINGQPMIIPCPTSQASAVPTSQPQQAPQQIAQPQQQQQPTLLQQNTTIVQQQTTLMANNALSHTTATPIMNPNFIINSNLLGKPFQDLTGPLLLQKHSVSTQTAGAQTQAILQAPTAVQCAGVPSSVGSPPDTTTTTAAAIAALSAVVPDTTTGEQASFVSSSGESEHEMLDWSNKTLVTFLKEEDFKPPLMAAVANQGSLEGIASALCGTGVTLDSEERRSKRKNSDLLVIEANVGVVEEEPDVPVESSSPRNLEVGDLVWGPARGFPSWPGKLVSMDEDPSPPSPSPPTSNNSRDQSEPLGTKVWVRWYGDVTVPSQVDLSLLKTLSEGLEAHHRATKKFRKGRKMNSQLENAIQEAMLDLDCMTSEKDKQLEGGTNKRGTSSGNNSSGGAPANKVKKTR